MRHLDLFSGIGGFSYAVDQVFGDVSHTFVEIDPFCQAILKKHWPESEVHSDIKQFITDTERDRLEGWEQNETQRYPRLCNRGGENENTFILTGGFPCQPFSVAGRRKGTADDRYLWPEMFRVIQLYKPTWIIAENVRGLTTWNEGMVLEQVCADLESEGYEVQPLIIPACAVNAPHRRDRVWIVANCTGERCDNGSDNRQERHVLSNKNRDAQKSQPEGNGRKCGTGKDSEIDRQPDWQRNWREVAATTCNDGVDDGLPRRMGGSTISRARWRKEALKAYGNAIVPQVAVEIMKSIYYAEKRAV